MKRILLILGSIIINSIGIICTIGYMFLIAYSIDPQVKWLLVIVNFIYIIISILCMKYIYKRYNENINNIYEYDYYRNINFKKVNPVVSGVLLRKENVNINTVITAIFHLGIKKICNIRYEDNKSFISLKVHDKEKLKKLLKYEKKILYFIFEDSNDEKEYSLQDIIKDLKENINNVFILKDIEKEIESYIDKKYYISLADYIENSENLPKAIWWGAFLGFVIYIYSILSITITIITLKENIIAGNIILIQTIIGIILGRIYSKYNFINKDYYPEIEKLYGLYNYMSDYTMLNEQETKFYQLYDEYYVYAMGMGIADRFENELKQEYLNKEVSLAINFYLENRGEIEC